MKKRTSYATKSVKNFPGCFLCSCFIHTNVSVHVCKLKPIPSFADKKSFSQGPEEKALFVVIYLFFFFCSMASCLFGHLS